MNQINARIQYKYDSETNWNKSTFISLAGETYVHQYDDGKVKLKFGDGIHKVPDLPFVNVGLDEGEMTGVSEVQIIQQPGSIKLRWKSPYQHSKYRQTILTRTNLPYLYTFDDEATDVLQILETTNPSYLMTNEGQVDKQIFSGSDEKRAISDNPGYCEYVDSAELFPGQEYTYVFTVYDKKNKTYVSEKFTITYTDSLIIYKDNFRFYIDDSTVPENIITWSQSTRLETPFDGNTHKLHIKYYYPDTQIEVNADEVVYVKGDDEYCNYAEGPVSLTPQSGYMWEDKSKDSRIPCMWGVSRVDIRPTVIYPNPQLRKYIMLLKTPNGFEAKNIKVNLPETEPLATIVWNNLDIVHVSMDNLDGPPDEITKNDETRTFSILYDSNWKRTTATNFYVTLKESTADYRIVEDTSFRAAKATINNLTWEEIANIENPHTYFSIGDVKKIVLDGQIGDYETSNEEAYVYIVDFKYDDESKQTSSGIYFAGFKKAVTNDRDETEFISVCLTDGNYGYDLSHEGGFAMHKSPWSNSVLREILCLDETATDYDKTLMHALPEDFRNILQPMTVEFSTPSSSGEYDTCVDYITIPGILDVFDENNDDVAPFEYFARGNSKKMASLSLEQDDNGFYVYKTWYTRDMFSEQGEHGEILDPAVFIVTSTGYRAWINNLNTSYGVVPIFLVGHDLEEESN